MNRGRAAARGARRARGGAAAGRTDEAGSSTTGEPSATPSESAGPSSTTARRGAATTRATRASSVGRFRPKAVRRDEADRDILARQEEQKASERAAEERRARGRSRNRSKRSRGDAMGSRGRGISTASGPFSGGFAGSSGRFGGGGGGFGGGSGGGFYGGGGRSLKSDGKGFGQADASRRRETRINADRLHVMTPAEELDSDDEVTITALKNQTASTLPMGIYRREHKETGVVVATTAELEAAENANDEEESLWVDGDGSAPPAQQAEEGVWNVKADKQVRIKTEPGLEDEMDLDPDFEKAPGEGKKPASERKPKKPVVQDPEEKTIQEDMHLLASELGAVTITENGETKIEGPANKDGRMYLFQFPPLLPPLKQMSSTQSKVKEERGSFGGLDAAPVDPGREEAGERARGEAEAVDDDDDEDDDEDEEEAAGGFRSQLLPQGGMIGKLNVRRSGKVELDWGGMTLEMSPAAGMGFLTTAVIVEENDEKAQGGEGAGYGGDAVGMGKIMGRFILAPIWSDEAEWNVAPEDLVVE